MDELEGRLKEQRLIQATQKGYTGLDGKIGIILRQLGEPIVSEESGAFVSTPMPDVWLLEDEEETEMPIYDEDANPSQIGILFDGLRRGMHLEMKFMENTRELTVTYEGHLVYKEEGGNLTCFIPHPDWEKKIENLYVGARKKEELSRKEEAKEEKELRKQEKLSFLEKLKQRWGTS